MDLSDPISNAACYQATSGGFVTTHWSEVLAAGETPSAESRAALERLCRTYWSPLYSYVRRSGHGSEDAQDLVQEFFARLLGKGYIANARSERGKFRTFLLTSLKHFLINEWTKAKRDKRGGTQVFLSLNDSSAESQVAAEPAAEQSLDEFYDRGWAAVLLQRAMKALETEFEESGRQALFQRLKGFVWGEQSGMSHAAMSEQLGMSEGAVKVAVHRLRQRYGELLRMEIAQTVATPVEVDQELRYLASIIRSGVGIDSNLPAKKV